MSWRPDASWSMLQQRAELFKSVRQFFEKRGVTEVDTHLLSQYGVSDIHLKNLSTEFSQSLPSGSHTLYLQTSPEFAMKRIIAAYQQDIYQLSHVVRDDEVGRFHNPEFTLLEWYRVGYDDTALIDEVSELLSETCGALPLVKRTYQECFLNVLKLDPLTPEGIESIRQHLAELPSLTDWMQKETDASTILQVAFSECIEPTFPKNTPQCVTHFPVEQAALARVDEFDTRVAKRFEVYYQGVELANGYHELTDAVDQKKRFQDDNQKRRVRAQSQMAADDRLIAALESGLPDCAGVALGFDRLLMIKSGAQHISEVLPFTINNA
ncbi:elongation factor P lysine(34) lysyltransferase [Idiomarina sp. X4]|uniref:EF-P lysine aminoacylase EpmA n=1 Tax=Idiomarina sp. X4 TaxID=2055892 RepID=UPI000C2949BD|nr:EF-P lysine aminoacylase EpmA [Idiomarina sp. X4]ATZ73524.1 elongation factor P lysine(34) lysyltransferase [Idiomarina sp. X4]